MEKENTHKNVSSILLIIFLAVTFVVSISYEVISKVVDDWYNNRMAVVVLVFLQIIRTICYILPALAIKDKTYRIVGVILTSILIVYLLISPILLLLKPTTTTSL